MKRKPIDLLTLELEESGIEEIDLSESAMHKRMFKKFYSKINVIDEDFDCADIEDEEDVDVKLEDEDTEVEGEDLP